MTIRQLRSRTVYWQQKLNIPEWTITVKLGGLTHKDHVGECIWCAEELTATICLKRGQGEETLIHELLHLVLDGHIPYYGYDLVRERAINRIAKALYLADQNKNADPACAAC